MGWGWRIAIFYGSFVVLMVGMVILAFQQDFDLVADDYYEQEVAYQGRIDQLTNAKNDSQKVVVSNVNGAIQLSFAVPAQDVKIHFFRPSDDTMDFKLEQPNIDSNLAVPITRFSKGKYLVKVEWKYNGKTYFQEDNLFIE
ncbi:FixH family protein [Bacteroidota bacterium]